MSFNKLLVSTVALTFSSFLAVSTPLADSQQKNMWSGLYFGLYPKYTENNLGKYFTASKEKEKQETVVTLGAGFFLGYNLAVTNNLLLGAEVGFDGKYQATQDSSGVLNALRDLTKLPTIENQVKVKLGVSAGRLLPYVYAGTHIKSTEYDKFIMKSAIDLLKALPAAKELINDAKVQAELQKYLQNGSNKSEYVWNLGAGLDLALTRSILIKVDYQLSATDRKFEDLKSMVVDLKDTATKLFDKESTNKFTHSLRVGVAYKF